MSQGEDKQDIRTFIDGFSTVDDYSRQCLRDLLQATKTSNSLPAPGNDFDYYSSFESFRGLMDMEGKRILRMLQDVMKHQSAKGNLAKTNQATELEEKFDILIDANDTILEKAGTFLDEAVGVRKTDTSLIVASISKQVTPKASWNKQAITSAGRAPNVSNLRLLTARNIPRPQLKFKDKIDNSSAPFVPKLPYKPNAQKSLADTLPAAPDPTATKRIDDEHIEYPHPYQYELDHLTYPESQFDRPESVYAVPLDETSLFIIADPTELTNLVKDLKKETEIAVDLEHHSYRTYLGITCLMQISTRSSDYIIDTLKLRSELHQLNEVFTDPAIVKVFHGCDSDIYWLQRDLGLYVVNLFDTGQASNVLNYPKNSLAYILERHCKVQANKEYQLADWRIRPLPEELIKYAREDTHYLLQIYDLMRCELLEKGNSQKNLLKSVFERSRQLCLKKYEKPVYKEDRYLEIYYKSRKVFNTGQQLALKYLYAWRDKVARSEDESTGYILPNHMLLQIAELLPREREGILACCNPIPTFVRQNLNELHEIVKVSRDSVVKVTKKPDTPKTSKADYLKPVRLQDHGVVDSLLNCPHDLSHDGEALDKQCNALDDSLVAKGSSMFKDEVTSIQMKASPTISIFSSTPKVDIVTDGQRRAHCIRASIASPFEMYIPKELRGPIRVPPPEQISAKFSSTEPLQGPTNKLWKLLKHTPKIAPKDTPEPKLVMRHVTADNDKPTEMPKAIRTGLQKDKKRKRTPTAQDGEGAQATHNPKKSRHDASMHKDNLEGFKPYNYKASDYSMFQGAEKSNQKKKGNKRQYNPNQPDDRFKAAKGPKLSTKSGKKSMTYKDRGGHSNQRPAACWPPPKR
ncbi:unnamed protein product [Owenia fusiformis]|uniref:Exosome complex component 10 homolog n=1 Tax=Owenia fusiformis TaxID=6347 RepID=A0A8S4N4R2_OWEFU|nr:unnamed protein product [Owenia fusiformis]